MRTRNQDHLYNGTPCVRCGETLRYKKGGRCHACSLVANARRNEVINAMKEGRDGPKCESLAPPKPKGYSRRPKVTTKFGDIVPMDPIYRMIVQGYKE